MATTYLYITDPNNWKHSIWLPPAISSIGLWTQCLWLWFLFMIDINLSKQVNPRNCMQIKAGDSPQIFCNIPEETRETCDFYLRCRKLETALLQMLQQKQPKMPNNQQFQNFVELIKELRSQSKQLTWNLRRKAAFQKKGIWAFVHSGENLLIMKEDSKNNSEKCLPYF